MLQGVKKYLPTAQSIKKRPAMRWISTWLQNRPYLWKFKKHSVSGSVAVSLFVAFLPLPFEMVMVTLLAILIHANLPIALVSTWITNPFTLIPANYFSYKVGEWLINSNGAEFVPLERIHFHWTNWDLLMNDISTFMGSLTKAYLIGLPIVSITVALISYALVYLIWTCVETCYAKFHSK